MTAPRGVTSQVATAVSEPGDPEAGRNVVTIAGCESCHMSPGQKDPLRLGGGMELKTPFGSFYPPNISPDPADGIGKWSAENFANALMAGVSPLGEHLYPAFPYPSSACRSRTCATSSPSYARFRRSRDARAAERAEIPVLDPPRGRVLEAPLHADNRPSARRRSDGSGAARPLPRLGTGALRGVPFAPRFPRWNHRLPPADRRPAARRQGQGAPNITAHGLRDWSESDITDALSTGFTPSGDVLGSAMAAVVRSLSHAPAADLAAIAHYLKTVEPERRLV